MKHLLTIAGSDSSGGAGIQADLKTFSALECFGMSVLAAITAQNTQTVTDVFDVPPDMIAAQLDAVFSDIRVDAVKIGMVSANNSIAVIAHKLRQYSPPFLVLDPVMVSKSGYHLLHPLAVDALKSELLPLASVVTPNTQEAEILAGRPIGSLDDMRDAARSIYTLGAQAVLIKGGHLEGDPVDLLFDGTSFTEYPARRIATKNTHGTGCTLSSAIAAFLARGVRMQDAVLLAKEYVHRAIEQSFALGRGHGPVHHFHPFFPQSE